MAGTSLAGGLQRLEGLAVRTTVAAAGPQTKEFISRQPLLDSGNGAAMRNIVSAREREEDLAEAGTSCPVGRIERGSASAGNERKDCGRPDAEEMRRHPSLLS